MDSDNFHALLFLIFGILVISAVQYFECLINLIISEKIYNPEAPVNKIAITASWLIFSILLLINCLAGLVLAKYLNFATPASKALIAVVPIASGASMSCVLQYRRWKAFKRKFK